MSKRLKVLISAYACSPYQGSEPGVGWGFVFELAKYHELWVIVEEEKFCADIERYLADNPSFSDSVHFYFIKKKRNRLLRKMWPPSYYWYYKQWHLKAYDLAKILHKEIDFDLVHQLTMVGFREPGFLWKLNIPFVWGPIGGMGLFPWRFLSMVGLYGAVYYFGYNLFNALQMYLSSRPRLAAQTAGRGLIAATSVNRESAARCWNSAKAALISEVGLPSESIDLPLHRSNGQALKIIWTGLHIPRKALNLGLLALAQLPSTSSWHLHVLGRGRQTEIWKKLAKYLGIEDKVTFHGWIPREQVQQVMQQGDLMLITSLRDLTSTVTVEALAQGLPIVCLDHCGFADAVNEQCGIKVPVTTPKQTVQGLTAAIHKLEVDETLRYRLACGAQKRSRDFAWPMKVEVLNDIYHNVIEDFKKNNESFTGS